MYRAIKFKLRNGKFVTLRRIRAKDYNAAMKYMDCFKRDIGALNTWQYPGRPRIEKEKAIKQYEDDNMLFIGVFDGDNIVGIGSIHPGKIAANHPYNMGKTLNATIGLSMLNKYTHNRLGSKLLQILEKWAREHDLHKISATIRHNNIPSIANCIKNGFIITGINYDTAYINGEYVHEYIVEKILQ